MKVLITPLFGIGDVIITTPAVEILKKNRPDIHLTYFVIKESIKQVLQNNPYIDEIIYYPLNSVPKWKGLFYMLKNVSNKFDVSLTFYPSNRKDYNLFSMLTLSKIRIGHRYIRRDFLELNWLKNYTILEDDNLHNVEENIKLLRFLGVENVSEIPPVKIYLTEEEKIKGRHFVKKHSSSEINIGIHAGSSVFKNHINKRWPKEKFAELINYFGSYHFFIFGGREDEDVNRLIKESVKNKNITVVKNKTIREVAGIMSHLDVFVSNDSGLMHLSAACGIPVVGIFGPTSSVFARPWCDKYKVVKLDLDCSPCFYYSPKPLNCKIYGDFRCIRDIPVEKVAKAVEDLVKQQRLV